MKFNLSNNNGNNKLKMQKNKKNKFIYILLESIRTNLKKQINYLR